MTAKILALCSGGGGTIRTIRKLLGGKDKINDISFEIIADRECGALLWARSEEDMESVKIDLRFDQSQLKQHIKAKAPCIVLTFVHRTLSPDVLSVAEASYINTHYSLLPSFGGTIGMKSLERALDSGCSILGATSHRVTEVLDGGPIIAQAAFARKGESKEELSKLMFACGCLSTLVALQTEVKDLEIIEEAIKTYKNEIGHEFLIGISGSGV